MGSNSHPGEYPTKQDVALKLGSDLAQESPKPVKVPLVLLELENRRNWKKFQGIDCWPSFLSCNQGEGSELFYYSSEKLCNNGTGTVAK